VVIEQSGVSLVAANGLKVAFVTGAGSGIGRAVAQGLVARGYAALMSVFSNTLVTSK
jgi:NADP-dependent 3-hydroxy acid dehydrogenase YdfG